MTAVAAELGLKVEFVGTDFSGLLAQVKNKKLDLGSSSITITDARKKTVAFTNGYDFGYFGLNVPAGSDIKTFDQLKGKRVTVVQGTVQDDYATKEGLNPVRVPDYNGALNQLKAGTAAAWVSPAEIGEKSEGQCWQDRPGRQADQLGADGIRDCPGQPGVPGGAEQGPGRGHQGRHLDQAPGPVLPRAGRAHRFQARQWQHRLPTAQSTAPRADPPWTSCAPSGRRSSTSTLVIWGPNPYPLGILALSLIASAYIGEVFRSGIQSVEAGQIEAARALGFSQPSGMRLVVIPQGVRRVLPALVNQFIALIKESSLVYFLGLLATQRDLFRIGQDQPANTGNESGLLLAGLFYLVITVPLTHLVDLIDSRLRTGRRRNGNDRADDHSDGDDDYDPTALSISQEAR